MQTSWIYYSCNDFSTPMCKTNVWNVWNCVALAPAAQNEPTGGGVQTKVACLRFGLTYEVYTESYEYTGHETLFIHMLIKTQLSRWFGDNCFDMRQKQYILPSIITPRSLISLALLSAIPLIEKRNSMGRILRQKDINFHLPAFRSNLLLRHHSLKLSSSLWNNWQSPMHFMVIQSFRSISFSN
jgi:hypothetical protein